MGGRPAQRGIPFGSRHRVLLTEGAAFQVEVLDRHPDVAGTEQVERLVGQLPRGGGIDQDPLRDGERDHVGADLAAAGTHGAAGQQPGMGPSAGAGVHHRSRPAAHRLALLRQLGKGGDEGRRAGRGAAAHRYGIGAPAGRGEIGCQLVLGRFQLVPGTGAGEVGSRSEQRRQQLVAARRGRRLAAEDEVDGQAEPGAGGGRHPTVVGLTRTHGHQRVGAGRQCRTAQQLELAGLVATHAQPGEIVPLDPQAGAAREPWTLLQRSGQGGQPHPRQVLQGHGGHVV